MAIVEKTSGKTSTVFVGNIPYDATEDDVRGHLAQGGKVESFRMVFDKETLQPKGYGFCDFADAETAMNAIKILSEKECNGRKLRLDLADNELRGAPGKSAGKGGSTALADKGIPAAAAADPNASADVIMASVSAHTQIAQTVAAMPQAHLQLCLGTMQELAKAAPERARATLLEHPQLCYALLHAQFLLGLSEPVLPPDLAETQQLRAEAVQRAMVNTKALGRRGPMGMRGGPPPMQRPPPVGLLPPPRPSGGYGKAPPDGLMPVKMDTS
eukprot:Skav219579  [mRNA]  locus=scaffold249:190086:190998:+ [translate_table: standard]